MICCVAECQWRKGEKIGKHTEYFADPLDCVYTGCPYRDGAKIVEHDGTEITVGVKAKGVNYEDEMRKDMQKLNNLAAEILNITDNWIT